MARLITLLLGTLVCLTPVVLSWPYGDIKIRGANLGSWLVVEKWITPSVFSGLPDSVNDEYQLCKYLGYAGAEKRLRAHWDSWVKEQDIINLKKAGINHIRIPIGYWALDIKQGEPWVSGSWDYVMKACAWAKTHGIQVMIDFHGAPGSQNGNDHSGKIGPINFFNSDDNLSRSVSIIGRIAKIFNTAEWKNTVTIIELLNEPILWDDYNYRLQRLKEFYRSAYDEVRKYNKDVVVAVHDAFISANNWYYLRDDSHYYSVMLDTHLYQLFGDSPNWNGMTCQQHANYPCTYRASLSEATKKLWTVVGEWSAATPEKLSCTNQREFSRNQIAIYETASGWFMFNFKHAQGWNEWSFLDAVRLGWINLGSSITPTC